MICSNRSFRRIVELGRNPSTTDVVVRFALGEIIGCNPGEHDPYLSFRAEAWMIYFRWPREPTRALHGGYRHPARRKVNQEAGH